MANGIIAVGVGSILDSREDELGIECYKEGPATEMRILQRLIHWIIAHNTWIRLRLSKLWETGVRG